MSSSTRHNARRIKGLVFFALFMIVAPASDATEYRIIPHSPSQVGLFELTGGSITTNGTIGTIDDFDITNVSNEYTLRGCTTYCTDGDPVLNEGNSHTDLHGLGVRADTKSLTIVRDGFIVGAAFDSRDQISWQNETHLPQHAHTVTFNARDETDMVFNNNPEPTPFDIAVAVPEPLGLVLAVIALIGLGCRQRRRPSARR
jgi:hypothetical protein